MRVLTSDRRLVSVSPPLAVGRTLTGVTPSYAGRGSVPLLRDGDGIRRRVTYALIARTNPWVMTAINERAGIASRIPLHVFRPDPDGREGHRERVRGSGEGAVLVRLLEQPEPRVSARKWKRRLVGDVLTHGNAVAEIVYSPQVSRLRWHPWFDVDPEESVDRVDVERFHVPTKRRLGLGAITQADTVAGGQKRVIDGRDAVHFTISDDTETALGVSPLAALQATHALHEAAWRFARAFLEEGMFPSGVVELPPQATVEQAILTRELLNEINVGIERAGRPAVIGFGKWQQVMTSPEQAQLVELAKSSREEVSAAYRLPMMMMGDQSSPNRATAQVSRQAWIRDVVGEDVAVLESEINAQLVHPQRRWYEAGLFVEGQLAEQLRPDVEAEAKVIRDQVGAPIMTINEGRRIKNLPPLDDPRADKLVLAPGTPGGGSGGAD